MVNLQNLRDTQINWIGHIPDHWGLKKIKYVFWERKENNNPIQTANLISLTIERGVIPHSEKTGGGNKPKEDLTKYKIVRPGDIVLNSMNVIAGAVGISKYFGIVSPVYYILIPVDQDSTKEYFHHLFRTELFQKSLYGLGNGILIKENEETGKLNTIRMRIPMEKLGDQFIPVPPLDEQKIIFRYLDKKASQIDLLINKIEKRIEMLEEQQSSLINQYVTKGLDPNVEMKDSGVEWIGEIPRHWEMRKITHATTMIGSGTTPKSDNEAYYLDGVINWSVTGDLNDGYVTHTSSKVTKKALKDHSSLKLYPINSLLMAMYGATIGKLGILKIEATVNQATCVMNFNENNLVEFWFNVLFGNRNYIISLGYGGGQPNISQDVIKNLRFPCPPTKKEQLEIVEAIKSRIGKHDKVVQIEHKRLALSKEYRQSLISSVVTGKVRVKEEMV